MYIQDEPIIIIILNISVVFRDVTKFYYKSFSVYRVEYTSEWKTILREKINRKKRMTFFRSRFRFRENLVQRFINI